MFFFAQSDIKGMKTRASLASLGIYVARLNGSQVCMLVKDLLKQRFICKQIKQNRD
jgi:hypothetical protein